MQAPNQNMLGEMTPAIIGLFGTIVGAVVGFVAARSAVEHARMVRERMVAAALLADLGRIRRELSAEMPLSVDVWTEPTGLHALVLPIAPEVAGASIAAFSDILRVAPLLEQRRTATGAFRSADREATGSARNAATLREALATRREPPYGGYVSEEAAQERVEYWDGEVAEWTAQRHVALDAYRAVDGELRRTLERLDDELTAIRHREIRWMPRVGRSIR
jgi:hypothetical protein